MRPFEPGLVFHPLFACRCPVRSPCQLPGCFSPGEFNASSSSASHSQKQVETIMSRELRLAFAMGGGVSLGIFPGAALSEAIKLAVLYGLARSSGTK